MSAMLKTRRPDWRGIGDVAVSMRIRGCSNNKIRSPLARPQQVKQNRNISRLSPPKKKRFCYFCQDKSRSFILTFSFSLAKYFDQHANQTNVFAQL
jgi:hypothetical protein